MKRFLVVLILAVMAECLWRTVVNLVDQVGWTEPDDCFAACREVGRVISPVADVAFLCKDTAFIDSGERISLINLNWEISPKVAKPVEWGDLPLWDGVVAVNDWTGENADELSGLGFSLIATNSFVSLYSRKKSHADAVVSLMPGPIFPQHDFRACFSVGVIVFLLVAMWLACRSGEVPDRTRVVWALLIFAIAVSAAVFSGLNAPNGLGVYGGKAKLFLLSGDIPSGFWTASEYAVFQPSYPPMMTLIALMSFAVGGVSDCALQIFLPGVLALLFLELTRHAPRNGWRSFATYAYLSVFLLSPEMISMATGFYAEPLAMLLLAFGWNAVLDGKCRRGCLAVGLVALTRPEGLMISAISLGVFALLGLVDRHSPRKMAEAVVSILLPGILWQASVWLLGSQLQDYDFLHFPSYWDFSAARAEIAKALCGEFVLNGGVFVCSVLILIGSFSHTGGSVRKGTRGVAAAVMMTLLCLFFGSGAISFSTCPQREWLYAMTLPRYSVFVSVPLLLVALRLLGDEETADRH